MREVGRTISKRREIMFERLGDILKRRSIPTKITSEVSLNSNTTEVCSPCHDIGWVYPVRGDGRPDYGNLVRCSCKTEEDRRQKDEMLLKMCELPQFLRGKTFANFKVSEENAATVAIARDIGEGTGPVKFLTLLGKGGSGKTHLAVAICQSWLERRQPARYAYVPLLLDELRQGIEDKSYAYRFQVYCTIPLLVLDDLGLENSGSWVTERLTTLINTRLVNELPLVVTSNKPLDELPGDDQHRIASRLSREDFCHTAVMKYTEH